MEGTGALIYFDPPYIMETRTRKLNGYRHEVTTDWHEAAALLLRQHEGPVVASGYASSLYAELYESYGWLRVDSNAVVNGGGNRTESLWLNPAVQEALALYEPLEEASDGKQLRLYLEQCS